MLLFHQKSTEYPNKLQLDWRPQREYNMNTTRNQRRQMGPRRPEISKQPPGPG